MKLVEIAFTPSLSLVWGFDVWWGSETPILAVLSGGKHFSKVSGS